MLTAAGRRAVILGHSVAARSAAAAPAIPEPMTSTSVRSSAVVRRSNGASSAENRGVVCEPSMRGRERGLRLLRGGGLLRR